MKMIFLSFCWVGFYLTFNEIDPDYVSAWKHCQEFQKGFQCVTRL